MLQARFSKDDQRLYSVYRDIAHNFKDVALIVAQRLSDDTWAPLADYLTSKGVSKADLGRACQAFCSFVMTATVKSQPGQPQPSMEDCLKESGWFDVAEPAQVAYMSYLGTVVAGYYFAGVRSACVLGYDPTKEGEDLREHGARAMKALTTPKWKRRLLGWLSAVHKIWSILRGTRR
jgi:hypothetical protein